MAQEKAKKIRELKRLEQKVYDYESKLNGSLEELSVAASLALGYEVAADLCHGNEIEFRVYGNYDIPDSDSCIRMEDIIAKLK